MQPLTISASIFPCADFLDLAVAMVPAMAVAMVPAKYRRETPEHFPSPDSPWCLVYSFINVVVYGMSFLD